MRLPNAIYIQHHIHELFYPWLGPNASECNGAPTRLQVFPITSLTPLRTFICSSNTPELVNVSAIEYLTGDILIEAFVQPT
jgi:hypothetical protein